MQVEIINEILAILTITALLFFIVVLFYLILFQKNKNYWLSDVLAKKGITLAFFIALMAVLGSLYYSEIAGYPPCDLCWYQRIFMYPQVILLGLAWWRKDLNIIKYCLSLAIIGALFALYHTYIAYGGQSVSTCTTATFIGISCLRRYVYALGFVTIPLMSLSAFVSIIIILLAQNNLNKPERFNFEK